MASNSFFEVMKETISYDNIMNVCIESLPPE